MSRTNGQEVAKSFADYVNNMCFRKEEFVGEVMNQHRTLQQAIFSTMMECMREWSNQYENGRYDLRNEDTCRLSNQIMKALGDDAYTRFI